MMGWPSAVILSQNNHAKDVITGTSPLCLAVYSCQGDDRVAALVSMEPSFGPYFHTIGELQSTLPQTIA